VDLLWIAAVFLLLASGFQLVIGILTPFLAFPVGIVGLSAASDERMWGKPSQALLSDRVVRDLRTHHTLVIGGLITGIAILQLFVAWYGVRVGETWAIAAFTIMGIAMLAWWVAMVLQFTRAGVRVGLGDVQPFVWVHLALWLPGVVLAWLAQS
jgi:hypothetical protein